MTQCKCLTFGTVYLSVGKRLFDIFSTICAGPDV